MNIEEFRDFCISKGQVEECFPFPKLPNLLVFKVKGKMFTATDISTFENFSIKHPSEYIENLKEQFPESILKHQYFSANHWILVKSSSIKISKEKMFELIYISYQLNLKKK